MNTIELIRCCAVGWRRLAGTKRWVEALSS